MAIRNCEPVRTCFKVGDKVRCKWAKNSDGTLTVGNVYKIQCGQTDGGSSVSVEGIVGAFDASRFELVKSTTRVSPWPKASRAGRAGTEKIIWVDASIQVPDEDITVLVQTADHVGEAVLDCGEWEWINAMPCPHVFYWAHMPIGINGGEL